MADLMELAEPTTSAVLLWCLEATVVGSILAALAALVSRIPRLASRPATRHALWLLVLIKLVVPPVISWPWSVRPALTRLTQEAARRPLSPPARIEFQESIEPASPDRGSDAPIGETEPLETKWVSSLNEPAAVVGLEGSPRISQSRLGVLVVGVWLVGSLVLAIGQARRVVRFRRLLHEATLAPDWLLDELDRAGRRMEVGVPPVLVVSSLSSPLLWCLGRPLLLIPNDLLKSLDRGRWTAILGHELAHLKRGDHWVRRLELIAGLVWWWNPLYRVVRDRLDHEAELACDAWAVMSSPGNRITYAESLIRIGSALPSDRLSAPSLGMAGTGRSFERRLTMILNERVECRVSAAALLPALLLAGLALPSWTVAQAALEDEKPITVVIKKATEDAKPTQATVRFIRSKANVTIDATRTDDDKAKKPEDDAEKAALQKKMKDLGDEMEQKFGPDSEFAKKMKALGEEMEKKFGPDSEFGKKMVVIGTKLAEEFGPDSEFTQTITKEFGSDSEFAKELAKEFGPDSAFMKDIKVFKLGQAELDNPDVKKALEEAFKTEEVQGKAMTLKAKQSKLKAEAAADRVKQKADQAKQELAKAKPEPGAKKLATVRVMKRPGVEKKSNEARIGEIESKIKELKEQLNQLKAELKEDDDES